MTIRIVHTADNHIGITYQRFKGDANVQKRLVAERGAALGRVVEEANRRQAHFLVVAGDLFDRPTVPDGEIKAVVETLAGFAGVAVLVLPGNHDFYEGPASKLWQTFATAAGNREIHVLSEPRVESFDVDGQAVRFYPCPCPSKLGEESLIGWVAQASKDAGAIHLGIAHGNVEGLGQDAQGRYFNMRQEDLRAAGVATWLLGHIHVPFPAPGSGGRPAFFMPGIHTPDSVKCGHRGHAWCLDVTTEGVAAFEQLVTGAVRFVRLEAAVRTAADVAAIEARCRELPATDTVLDLQIGGRLKADDRQALEALVDELRGRFLTVTYEPTVAHELTAAELAEKYPSDSVSHRILAKLLDDPEHPDAAWLAHELFQEQMQAGGRGASKEPRR